jgi:hypothetical protein
MWLSKTASSVSIWIAWRYARLTASMKAATCSSSIPTNASTAESANPNARRSLEKWLELNSEYSKSWPNITVKREGPADGKEWDGVKGKLKNFDPEPGTGD